MQAVPAQGDCSKFLICSHARMQSVKTKGDLLIYCLAFELSRVRLDRRKLDLTEEERYQLAADVVAQMRKRGGWRDLDEPLSERVGHP